MPMGERFLLVLWLTDRCNLSCSYCYAGACEAGQDMTFETAKTAIDALASQPLKIQFAGGEPTLNFALAEKICQYVRMQEIDAVFQMQTNGTVLTEEMVTKIRKQQISVGVSLDGPPQINDLTRGHTAQAVQGIRLLGQQGMVIGINAVVTAQNVQSLPKLVEFAFYLGNVGGIGLDLLRKAGRGTGQLLPAPEQLAAGLTAMYQKTQTLQKNFGRTVVVREIELARKRLKECSVPGCHCYASCGRAAVVLPGGKVYPCGSLISEKYKIGTVADLRDGKLPDLRSENRSGCGACSYRQVCPRGCPARGRTNGDDLECVLLKTAFQLAEEQEK